MKVFSYLSIILALIFTVSSCEDPYFPEINEKDHKPLLVVDGFINANGPQTVIKLSLTSPILTGNEVTNSVSVFQAEVSLKAENGNSYTALKKANHAGEIEFIIDHPVLNPNTRYFIQILYNGQEYHSEPSTPRDAGSITDISFEHVDEGLRFYVSSEGEGAGAAKQYFRWEFDETWKFASRFNSNLMVKNNEVVPRSSEEQIHQCFFNEISREILINSTKGLNENTIYKFPILTIPTLSEKVGIRYSMLLKQYGLSPEAYFYYEVLRKNNQELGDIFGTMPSELQGNIKNINDPDEMVIGYMEVSKFTEKRIFVDGYKDLRGLWKVENSFYQGCQLSIERPIEEVVEFLKINPGYMPAYGESRNPASADPTHVFLSLTRCIDCSVRGKLEEPDFWVN